jgi:hypothetical protein
MDKIRRRRIALLEERVIHLKSNGPGDEHPSAYRMLLESIERITRAGLREIEREKEEENEVGS